MLGLARLVKTILQGNVISYLLYVRASLLSFATTSPHLGLIFFNQTFVFSLGLRSFYLPLSQDQHPFPTRDYATWFVVLYLIENN